MQQQTILFRADGNASIGMGHFTRSLALAEMLREDFRCVFATQQPTDEQFNDMVRVCAGTIILPIGDGHFDAFLDQLTGDEWVVLDNYYYHTDYQKAIKSKGCTLICIDDMHHQHFVADLIINHAPGISPKDYEAESYTRFALGLDFVLLRPLFLEQAQKERSISRLDTLMICFGGSDSSHLTERALKAATNVTYIRRILAITGPAYQATNELHALIEQDARIEHLHALSERQMLEAMLQTDVAIVPSSSILLELMTVGVGIVTGYYVDNQRISAHRFDTFQLAWNVGDLRLDLESKVLEKLERLTLKDVNAMVQTQKGLMKNSKPAFIKLFNDLAK